jgi:hypothetical protein
MPRNFEMANEMSWATGAKPWPRAETLATRIRAMITAGDAEPKSPLKGESFYNTTTHQLKTWDGEKWLTMTTGEGGGVPGLVDQGILTDKILERLMKQIEDMRQTMSDEDRVELLKTLKGRINSYLEQGNKQTKLNWYCDRLVKAALLDDLESFQAILGELYDPFMLQVRSINPLVLVRNDP